MDDCILHTGYSDIQGIHCESHPNPICVQHLFLERFSRLFNDYNILNSSALHTVGKKNPLRNKHSVIIEFPNTLSKASGGEAQNVCNLYRFARPNNEVVGSTAAAAAFTSDDYYTCQDE